MTSETLILADMRSTVGRLFSPLMQDVAQRVKFVTCYNEKDLTSVDADAFCGLISLNEIYFSETSLREPPPADPVKATLDGNVVKNSAFTNVNVVKKYSAIHYI